MAMGRRRHADTEDLDEVYASIIAGEQQTGVKSIGKHVLKWRKERRSQLEMKEIEEKRQRARQAAYEKSLFALGGEPAVQLPKTSVLAPPPQRTRNVGMIPKKKAKAALDRSAAGIKEWAVDHRPRLIKWAVGLTILLLMIVLPYQIIRSRSKADQASTGSLAPEKVFTPRNLPEGFSVGSGSKTLENGALLYDVYGPGGELITISQQAIPEGFDTDIFDGAMSFDSRMGKSYIIENIERITGYIISTDSMLLFNSVEAISSSDLRLLMESFRP